MVKNKFYLVLFFLFIPTFLFAQLPKRGNNGLWGFVDRGGNWIISPRFDDVDRFSEGLAKVTEDGVTYGFIDLSGNWVIAPSDKYKRARQFSDGVSVYYYKDNYYAVNRTGEVLFKQKSKVSDFKGGVAVVDGKKCIDKTGKFILPPQNYEYFRLEFTKHGYIIKGIHGTESKEFTGSYYEYNSRELVNGVVPHTTTQGVGFLNKNGSWIISPAYLEVTPFDNEGHAIVLTHNKNLVMIDKSGNICAELVDYSIPIPKRNMYGLIDRYDAYGSYGLRNDGIARLQAKVTSNIVYVYKSDLLKNSNYVVENDNSNDVSKEQKQVVYTQPVSHIHNDATVSSTVVDVDAFVPIVTRNNDNAFAIIIANEDYRRVEKVQYALNDGRTVRDYCHKTLGIPESNIHLVENATLNDIRAEINWMSLVAETYKGTAKFIFYYAGHGIPDEQTRTSYLLPVDGYGTDVTTGYKLSDLYSKFNSCPAESIVVMLDACFSGSQRGNNMLASARGVAIRAKPEMPSGNVVVFSAASGDETAYPFNEKQHGLFTYYLLKKLQDTHGDVTLGELGDYIIDKVSKESIVRNSKSQTPTVTPSSVIGDWTNMKL